MVSYDDDGPEVLQLTSESLPNWSQIPKSLNLKKPLDYTAQPQHKVQLLPTWVKTAMVSSMVGAKDSRK